MPRRVTLRPPSVVLGAGRFVREIYYMATPQITRDYQHINTMTALDKYELIEEIDPPADAMVRTFYCVICDRAHLQTGQIARVWVRAAGGYSANASMACFEAML